MDPFAQHAEAARLLVAAARVLKDGTQKVRQSYRRQSRSRQVAALDQELLSLIRAALQLVAASDNICRELYQRSQSARRRQPRQHARSSGRSPAGSRSRSSKPPQTAPRSAGGRRTSSR